LATPSRKKYGFAMTYLTVEVEIDHGRIVPRDPSKLPQNGKGLLTVLAPEEEVTSPKLSPLEALEALQQHLKLDERKAAEWKAAVRDARR
jgi:hypothetical protein